MTGAQELLNRLAGLDVKVELINQQLKIDAPRGVLTGELKQQLLASRPELLALLRNADPGIQPVPAAAVIPLASGQQRLWALIERQPKSGVYNVPTVYRLHGDLDVEALKHALGQIHRRHAILRSTFRAVDGVPRQEVTCETEFGLPISDLGGLSEAEQAARVGQELIAEIRRPFDLGEGPPWRAAVLRLSAAEHVLMLTMHHLVFDRFSKGVLLRELEALYAGKGVPALALQFHDFAYWQQSAAQRRRVDAQMDYWRSRLGGAVPELLLPTDRPRAGTNTFDGRSQIFSLPVKLTRELESLSRGARGTMFMTLLAAFHALLNRYTGQADQIVCVPVACRHSTAIEALIGYFSNVVPIRTDLSGDPSFSTLLGRVRRVTMEASKHQDAPLQQIAKLPNLASTPLTRGMFNFRSDDAAFLNLEGITATPVENRRQQADFDLALYMGMDNDTLAGVVDYNAVIFSDQSIASMLSHFEAFLAAVAADPDRPLSALPMLRRRFPRLESALARHPKVDAALVAVRSDAGSSGNLVCYLELNEHDLPTREEMRSIFDGQTEADPEAIVFVPLDQLPKLDDGSVDLQELAALPPPTLSRDIPGNEYVAPRTPLEKELAEIWQRALWRAEQIGIHDNFFDLGGHSLLAVQLISETEKHLGRPVPGAALAELSTIAQFADFLQRGPKEVELALPAGLDATIHRRLRSYTSAWSGKRSRPDSLVVGLNTQGARQPVFWCVQRYLNITQLAKYLGPDQPLYGMRSGHQVLDPSATNIRALASLYVAEILDIQSSGPFLVGGICQAAEIALRIALELIDRGHELNLLCLQERFIPLDYPGRVAFFFGDASDRSPYFFYARPEMGWRKFYAGGVEAHIIRGAHGQYFGIESNCAYLAMKMQLAFEGAQHPPSVASDTAVPLQRLGEAAYRAKLTVATQLAAAGGDQVRLAVSVSNASAETWLCSERSGVFLGARWLDPKKSGPRAYTPYAHAAQARTALPTDLNPGETVALELLVVIPQEPRFTILEVDMVDEGIAWFSDLGSDPVRVEIAR